MREEWRIIASHPDYAVSSHGRVKRVVPDRHGRGLGRMMTPVVSNHGYQTVTLHRDCQQSSHLVHRLVCTAFHGVPPVDNHASHGDGDKTNNRADNLRWASVTDNNLDKHRHGTMRVGDRHHARAKPETMPRGTSHGNAKLTDAIVMAIRADQRSQRAIAEELGVSQSLISMVRTRQIWAHI